MSGNSYMLLWKTLFLREHKLSHLEFELSLSILLSMLLIVTSTTTETEKEIIYISTWTGRSTGVRWFQRKSFICGLWWPLYRLLPLNYKLLFRWCFEIDKESSGLEFTGYILKYTGGFKIWYYSSITINAGIILFGRKIPLVKIMEFVHLDIIYCQIQYKQSTRKTYLFNGFTSWLHETFHK